MSEQVAYFTGGDPEVRAHINHLTDKVNQLLKLRGDEQFIGVDQSMAGGVVKLNINAVAARIPKIQGAGGTLKFGVVSTSVGGGPNWAMVNPCTDRFGHGVDTSIEVQVFLVSPNDTSLGTYFPSVPLVAGKILAYIESPDDISGLTGFALPFVFQGFLSLVRVEKDGGSDGTNSSTASYTYTVKTADGNLTLAANVTPARPRPFGAVTYQSPSSSGGPAWGFAVWDPNGAMMLWDAGEIYNIVACTSDSGGS